MQRPNDTEQMTCPCRLIASTGVSKINGVERKTYPAEAAEGALPLFFASVRAYGGTERVQNDLLVIEDTVMLKTWYRPDITADCRVRNLRNGKLYEIISMPEDWNERSQFLVCKLRRVQGNG